MTKEALTKQIFDECAKEGEPVTMEEAEEMAEMEIKSGNIKLSLDRKKGTPRKAPTRKADDDKRYLIQTIAEGMINAEINAEITNIERQIDFTFNNDYYSITLTKHRPPK